ncbi:MAG: glycosyltransferase [Chitinivibrionales bacterium]|nr:glycosyltransferase [Chitinivibrionales bacterium]
MQIEENISSLPPQPEQPINWMGICFSSALFIAATVWLSLGGPLGRGGIFFAIPYILMFAGMFGAWNWWPKNGLFPLMAFVAVTSRLIMLDFPANDDIYRYIWEGYIQLKGFNPFALAPDSPSLEYLRTPWWDLINHKDYPTIYFPVAQILFAGVSFFSATPAAFKILFTLFDLGTLFILVSLVTHLDINKKHLLFYAFNPLVILFIAGEGHLDSVYVFFFVTSLLFMVKNRFFPMYLFLGLSIMVKPIPVIVLPLLIRKENFKYLPAVFIPFLLLFFYTGPGVSFTDVPFRFAVNFRFNGFFHTLFSLLFGAGISTALSWALFFIIYTGIFFLVPGKLRALFLALSAFLLCSPTLHPWYLVAIAPFLVIYHSPLWVTLFITIAAVFPTFWRYWEIGTWELNDLQLGIEFIPLFPVWLWTLITGNNGMKKEYGAVSSFSVIIPVLNEESSIWHCIESVKSQQAVINEIIVVDGGSSDNTRAIAGQLSGVTCIDSAPGRGIQIIEGLKHATGDIILVLHGDSRLMSDSLKRLVQKINQRPQAVGGSFGARYESTRMHFRAVEYLNNFRALVFGVSFGDQAQFFRRNVLYSRYPAYRLMEDIEFAFRMNETGPLLFIPRGAISSIRRWQQKGYAGNFLKVVALSLLFIIRRRFGLIRDKCEWFYERYYG